MLDEQLRYLADRMEILDVSRLYARAVDRRQFELLREVFVEDATLMGNAFRFNTLREIIEAMAMLAQYKSTFHSVHNQLVEIDGDCARAETYCVANHIYEIDGEERKLDWGIRYLDKLVRVGQSWKLQERELVLDWTQDLPLRAD
jgi:hypothetical protein